MARSKTVKRRTSAQPVRQQQLPSIILQTPPGMEKFSTVLLRFAEPLMQDLQDDLAELQQIVAISVTIWNLALLPPDKHAAVVAEMLRSIPAPLRAKAKQEIQGLIERRLREFADYHWPIAAFRVDADDKRFHVEVMAVLK